MRAVDVVITINNISYSDLLKCVTVYGIWMLVIHCV